MFPWRKSNIAHYLIKLHRRYGKSQLISVGIIGGHGGKNHIQFGGLPLKHRLTKQDMEENRIRKVGHLFIPKPTIILISCSTGLPGGIAEEIAGLGAKVIAPDQDTNIKHIKANIQDGKLDFSVDYYEPNTAKTYTGY